MATPNGLYLTYPPSHFVAEFRPTFTEWYLSPSAHPSLLTLTPPHTNPFKEGSSLTVSVGYALRAPGENDAPEGPPLAVVSGDITLNALRVFVKDALPLCERESVECVIVDDSGNLVYEEDLESFNGQASFFGQSVTRLKAIVANLTTLVTKRQCADLVNVILKFKRFHSVSGVSNW